MPKLFYPIIACLVLAACHQDPKPITSSSQQAASDSFTNYVRRTVNPLFVEHETNRSRAILDSLAPVVKKGGNAAITATFMRFMGLQYLIEKKVDSAMGMFRQSLAIAIAVDTSQKQIISVKTQIADVFIERKQFDSAIAYAREAYYLAKKKDTTQLPQILLKLNDIYFSLDDRAALKKHLFEGFNISAHSPRYRFAFANNITKYYDMVNEPDSALDFFRNFVEKDTSLKNPMYSAIQYENLGILLTKKDLLKPGLEYQLKAMKLNRELNKLDAASIFNTAVTYSKLKHFDTAAQYLNEAMKLAIEEDDQGTITSIWHRRSTNLRQQGRYKEALAALDSSYSNYEREVDSSYAEKARELETQYAVKAKDDEIRALAFSNEANKQIGRQQQLIIIILIGAFALIGSLALVLRRRRKLTEKLRETSLEQRLLRSQMEPHFIFNTLSVLQSFIRNNDTEKAVRFLNQFAKLLRVTLENSRESFVPLKEEVAALENYLSLQSMRFEGTFDYTVMINEEDEDLMIPPMLLQPFVENAILHGLKQVNHKGHVSVAITRRQHVLHCVIEDNGGGIAAATEPPQKRSLSTLITQERLEILARQTRQPASIAIVDKRAEQAQGTRVELQIPFKRPEPFNGKS